MLTPVLDEIAASAACLVPSGDPHSVLDIADAVYAQGPCDLSMLAALHGRPSFHLNNGEFRRQIPEHVSALISDGTYYTDPFTGGPTDVTKIAQILGDWRRSFNRSRDISVCTGISLWKRRRIAQLLRFGETSPPFSRSARAALTQAASRRGAVAGWSTRLPPGLEAGAEQQKIPLFRVEDGFIRSAGLGSGLLPPASIVVDKQGIYFDPAKPSDLETLLADTVFSEAIIQRAKNLISLLAARGVSKYAAGGAAPALRASLGQRIILVPGQVADDLSVRLGATGAVRSNIALLEAVRLRNPSAYIVYRPHPDVEAGYRRGHIADPAVLAFADQSAPGGSMAALIGAVDEVHTMTSLAGFEALLRGRIVETYGQPFYAGWGLTTDHAPLQRRTRKLRLEELAAATLILYPHYVDPATGLPCGPETLIARLDQAELWRPSALMRLRHLQGQAQRALRKFTGIRAQLKA